MVAIINTPHSPHKNSIAGVFREAMPLPLHQYFLWIKSDDIYHRHDSSRDHCCNTRAKNDKDRFDYMKGQGFAVLLPVNKHR